MVGREQFTRQTLDLFPGVKLNVSLDGLRAMLARYAEIDAKKLKEHLRLHIDPRGNLTVYPVGVRRPARWKLRPNAPAGAPFFVPRRKDGAPRPELIEEPVAVDHAPDPPARRAISLADMSIVGGSPTGKGG